MIATKLDAAIKSVCPIHGVSIGRKDDKKTWRIDFKDEATDRERSDALAVIEAFDVTVEEQKDAAMAQIRQLEQRELAPRFSREGILGLILKAYISDNPLLSVSEAVSNLTNQQHADYNTGFAKLKALDDAIKALRAQL